MVKALQLIQLNGPGPSFQGKASFSKFQKEAKEVLPKKKGLVYIGRDWTLVLQVF